jgi:hypothetical protein
MNFATLFAMYVQLVSEFFVVVVVVVVVVVAFLAFIHTLTSCV